jgi:hypothetical protein
MQHKLCDAFKPLIKKRRRALSFAARGCFDADGGISGYVAFVVAADDISRSPAIAAVGAPRKIARQPTGSRPMTVQINDLMDKIRLLEASWTRKSLTRYAEFSDHGDADAYRKLSTQMQNPNKPKH